MLDGFIEFLINVRHIANDQCSTYIDKVSSKSDSFSSTTFCHVFLLCSSIFVVNKYFRCTGDENIETSIRYIEDEKEPDEINKETTSTHPEASNAWSLSGFQISRPPG